MTTKTKIRATAAALAGAAAIAGLAGLGTGTAAAASAAPDSGAWTLRVIAPVFPPGIFVPVGDVPASVHGDTLTIAGHSGKLVPVEADGDEGARTTIAGVPISLWPVPDEDGEYEDDVYIVDIAGVPNSGNLIR